MKSIVSERGQTVIPKEVRDAAGIEAGSEIEWVYRDGKLSVFIIPKDPVRALRGILKGHGTFADFINERNEERERERKRDEEEEQRWRDSSSTHRP